MANKLIFICFFVHFMFFSCFYPGQSLNKIPKYILAYKSDKRSCDGVPFSNPYKFVKYSSFTFIT